MFPTPYDGSTMKDKQVMVRVSPLEKAEWEAAAKRCGMSLSRWMRAILNGLSKPYTG